MLNKKVNFSYEKFSCFPKPRRFGKKGVSIIIGYVLLVAMVIALSILVYNWLKFYVQPGDEGAECPDGVALAVKDYECSEGVLKVTIQNKGLFSVDGFVLKVNDRLDAEFGIYKLDEVEEEIKPGEDNTFEKEYFLAEHEIGNGRITLIDVQPFIVEEGQKIFCERVAVQGVDC